MAELTHFYNEVNATGSRSSLSWSNTMTTGTSPASIAGTSLSPNTKYLIIARALFGGEDIGSVFRCRVSTADDTTIETKSEMRVEFQNANTDVSYFFVHSYTTDSSPADVEFQLYGNNVVDAQIDQSSLFLLDLDALNNASQDTYYFDASDAGPTDTGNDWADDANGFDGSTLTEATSLNSGGRGRLEGTGTNAPASGGTIDRVEARGYYGTDGSGAGWWDWFTLTEPSGGWTWAKLQALHLEWINEIAGTDDAGFFVYESDGGTQLGASEMLAPSTSAEVYRAEIRVTHGDGNYYEDIQAATGTEYEVSPTTSTLATIPSGDLGTADHLILGYARAGIGSTGRYYNHHIIQGSIKQRHTAEGEDTSEKRITGFAMVYDGSGGAEAVTIAATEEAANGNMTDEGAYLIALPTSLFADVETTESAGGIAVDGTETTVATISNYTPSTNGNHLIFGWASGNQTPTALGGMHVESGTTEIRTGDGYSNTHNQIWDNTKDEEFMVTFQRYSISSQVTLNLRSQGAGADFDLKERFLTVVNLNEGAGTQTVTVNEPTETEAAQAVAVTTSVSVPVGVVTETEVGGVAPSVVAVGTVYDTADTAVTDHDISVPAGMTNGNMLLVFFFYDGGGGATSTDLTEILDEPSAGSSGTWIGYRAIDGTEGSTVRVTTGVGEQAGAWAIEVDNWDGDAPEISTEVEGNTDSPDSPSFTPTGGAIPRLWFSIVGRNGGNSVGNVTTWAYPDNQNTMSTGGSGSAGGIWSTAQKPVATDDPQAYLLGTSGLDWSAFTMTVESGIPSFQITPLATVSVSVGAATETEVAQPITSGQQVVAVNESIEAESVQAIGVILDQTIAVNEPTETESAQPVTVTTTTSIAVVAAAEAETAQPVTVAAAISVTVAVAVETETIQAVAVTTSVSVVVDEPPIAHAQPISSTRVIAGAVAATVPTPEPLLADDVLVLIVETSQAAESGFLGPPSGGAWTTVEQIDTNSGVPNLEDSQLEVYSHVYDGVTPPNMTLPTAADHVHAAAVLVRGADPLDPIDVSTATRDDAYTTTPSAPAVVTTQDNALILVACAAGDSISPAPVPTAAGLVNGADLLQNVSSSSGDDGAAIAIAGWQAAAGNTGTVDWTSNSERHCYATIAFNAGPGGVVGLVGVTTDFGLAETFTAAVPVLDTGDQVVAVIATAVEDDAPILDASWSLLAEDVSGVGLGDERLTVGVAPESGSRQIEIPTGADHYAIVTLGLRSVGESGASSVTIPTPSTSEVETPGGTTGTDNEVVIAAGAWGDDFGVLSSIVNANLDDFEIAGQEITTFGHDGQVGVALGVKALAGAWGDTTFNLSQAVAGVLATVTFPEAIRPIETESVQPVAIRLGVVAAVETESAQSVGIRLGVEEAVEAEAAQIVVADAGQVAAVNEPTETESAQAVAITTAISVAVNEFAETESAQPIAAATSATVAVVAAVETEAAQPIAIAVSITITTAVETEPVQPIGIGLEPVASVETEAVQTVAVTVNVTVAAASETETAQTVTPVAGVASIAVVFASELETGRLVQADSDQNVQYVEDLEAVQAIGVGLEPVAPVESEAAQPVAALSSVSVVVGSAVETEAAQPIAIGVGVPVTAGTEAELAQTIAPAATFTGTITATVETESAIATGIGLSVPYVAETETARPVLSNLSGVAQISLASVADPTVHDSHSVGIRAYRTGDTGTLHVWLYEGATEIANWSQVLTGSVAEYSLPVTTGEAATITSYANLELRFQFERTGSTTSQGRVTQAWLSVPEFAVGGQTITVNEPTETESAQPIAVIYDQTISVVAASETESAQPITVISPVTIAVTEATETESAQPVAAAALASIAVTSATETESGQIVGVGLEVVYPAETEIVQPVSVVSPASVAITEAIETESSVATPATTTISVNVVQANETESAQSVTAVAVRSITVAAVSETESAQLVQADSDQNVQYVVDVELVQAVGIGLEPVAAVESESAQAITPVASGAPQSIAVNEPTETELVQPIAVAASVTVAVNEATETESAQPVTVATSVSIAVVAATESELAQTVTPVASGAPQSINVVYAAEAEAVQPVAVIYDQSIAVAAGVETELAQPIAIATTATASVVAASETELVQGISNLVSAPVVAASEAELAVTLAIAAATSITVQFVQETDTVEPLTVATVYAAAILNALEAEAATFNGIGLGLLAAPETEEARVVQRIREGFLVILASSAHQMKATQSMLGEPSYESFENVESGGSTENVESGASQENVTDGTSTRKAQPV